MLKTASDTSWSTGGNLLDDIGGGEMTNSVNVSKIED